MRRGKALCLYRIIFGGLIFFPIGYLISNLPYIGNADDFPQVIEWWARYHHNACAFWILFGAILGALWHLIEQSTKSSN